MKKKVDGYNKTQTTPKNPDNIIPFIDRMTVGINFKPDKMSEGIQSSIWGSVSDKDDFLQVPKKGSYNCAWRIKIASALKIKHYPFMQYRHANHCAERLSLTFSPHDLGEDGLNEMHAALVSIVPDGWVSFVKFGHVSMIEISVDFFGVTMNSFHILPQQVKTAKTWSTGGQLETVLFGQKNGNQTRVYDRAKKRKDQKQPWTLGPVTRLERVLRKQHIAVSALLDLENQFNGIKMVNLPSSPPPTLLPNKRYIWDLFCDAVAVRGMPVALKLLPADTYRKTFRAWIAQHPRPWWKPDEIWECWKPMIEQSRLSSTDWT